MFNLRNDLYSNGCLNNVNDCKQQADNTGDSQEILFQGICKILRENFKSFVFIAKNENESGSMLFGNNMTTSETLEVLEDTYEFLEGTL